MRANVLSVKISTNQGLRRHSAQLNADPLPAEKATARPRFRQQAARLEAETFYHAVFNLGVPLAVRRTPEIPSFEKGSHFFACKCGTQSGPCRQRPLTVSGTSLWNF